MLIAGRDYVEMEYELKETLESINGEARETLKPYDLQIEALEEEIRSLKREKNKVQQSFREKKKKEQEKLYEPAREYFLNHIWEMYRYDIYVDFELDVIEKTIDGWVNKYSRDEIQTALDMSFEKYYEKYGDGDGVKAFEYVTRIAFNRKHKFWVIPRECLSWLYQNERLNVRHVAELIDRPVEKLKRLKSEEFLYGRPIQGAVELKEIGSLIIKLVEEYKESDEESFRDFMENRGCN